MIKTDNYVCKNCGNIGNHTLLHHYFSGLPVDTIEAVFLSIMFHCPRCCDVQGLQCARKKCPSDIHLNPICGITFVAHAVNSLKKQHTVLNHLHRSQRVSDVPIWEVIFHFAKTRLRNITNEIGWKRKQKNVRYKEKKETRGNIEKHMDVSDKKKTRDKMIVWSLLLAGSCFLEDPLTDERERQPCTRRVSCLKISGK